ncbi:MAG: phosphoglycerate kinase [Bacilli bacterium]|nr:phosphoglycerate kinase [Bacilli bacterium]MDD4795297.1 phosphoglycerate kinase [Bacilli bacterium]
MKTIKDIDIKDKNVILRCDFNVPIKDGNILSDEKIISSLKTINYLLSQNSKIIIMSHLGKIKTDDDLKKNTLLPVYIYLKNLLPDINIFFSKNTIGEDLENLVNKLKQKEILLIENTRFEDIHNKKESNCDLELARYWSNLGEVFIDDAFGLTHRKHASNYGIKKYLPSAMGFLIEEEIKNLEPLINPTNPFTVIMGGAKVEDKSLLIKNILERCDYLLLGGGIANTFLSVNHEVGKSLISPEYINEAKELLLKYPTKIIMPLDVTILNNDHIFTKNINAIYKEDIIYDIGPKTINLYKEYIDKSNLVFMNGTVGLYEDQRFAEGTRSILEMCSLSKSKCILGGGDAVASSSYFNIKDFEHLSTGGGATLEYISTSKLKSVEDIC